MSEDDNWLDLEEDAEPAAAPARAPMAAPSLLGLAPTTGASLAADAAVAAPAGAPSNAAAHTAATTAAPASATAPALVVPRGEALSDSDDGLDLSDDDSDGGAANRGGAAGMHAPPDDSAGLVQPFASVAAQPAAALTSETGAIALRRPMLPGPASRAQRASAPPRVASRTAAGVAVNSWDALWTGHGAPCTNANGASHCGADTEEDDGGVSGDRAWQHLLERQLDGAWRGAEGMCTAAQVLADTSMRRVPRLAGVLREREAGAAESGQIRCLVADPSGALPATLHAGAVEAHPALADAEGVAVLLRDVAVLRVGKAAAVSVLAHRVEAVVTAGA